MNSHIPATCGDLLAIHYITVVRVFDRLLDANTKDVPI